MNITCAACGTENEEGRVSFNAICKGCGGYLHSCIQCRLYCESSRGCTSSTTEETGDPSHVNFCEEFEPLGRRRVGQGSSSSSADSFLDLFRKSGEKR